MRFVITGGGTGGHLFPGIALAEAVRQIEQESRILFIGTERKLDKQTLQKYDFEQATLRCLGLKGMGRLARLRSILMLPRAVFEAFILLRRFKPDLVFGVGGYVTGPVLLAAKVCGIPSCIHEQNSVPGLANSLAGRLVNKIFISIPVIKGFPVAKARLTGNPVRKAILEAAGKEKKTSPVPRLLVLGGSQGAHAVNLLVTEAAGLLQEQGVQFEIVHQSGQADIDYVKERYARMGIEAVSGAFFDDMAEVYRDSDLVVSRAGATTLAELSVMGLPAVLIPFSYAADNHQEINARHYVAGGGAEMVKESEINGLVLAEKIKELLRNPDSLNRMGRAMRSMAKPDATENIVSECLQLVKR